MTCASCSPQPGPKLGRAAPRERTVEPCAFSSNTGSGVLFPPDRAVSPIALWCTVTCAWSRLRSNDGSSQDVMRPKKIILCVDDNQQALSVRQFMLETCGYRVLSTTTPEEALEIFSKGAIDLVLSDLLMPRMDGNEMIRRMKELIPETPMILISGSVKAFERANRADAFLPKGACSAAETLDRIRLLIARKRGPKRSSLAQVSAARPQDGIPSEVLAEVAVAS